MMVVRKKSIRIVWRDGFFLYLCSEINNNLKSATIIQYTIKGRFMSR